MWMVTIEFENGSTQHRLFGSNQTYAQVSSKIDDVNVKSIKIERIVDNDDGCPIWYG